MACDKGIQVTNLLFKKQQNVMNMDPIKQFKPHASPKQILFSSWLTFSALLSKTLITHPTNPVNTLIISNLRIAYYQITYTVPCEAQSNQKELSCEQLKYIDLLAQRYLVKSNQQSYSTTNSNVTFLSNELQLNPLFKNFIQIKAKTPRKANICNCQSEMFQLN
ncbi:UNKNOWN [Stylonychia lemnae]|uniref:Uncharacterized protein n=1 Tax=Stylonychia lemnae TaxID=5949 RepID=A0A078A5K6_STYLE|nr:UNKNOWN [Stylonychia lemnae]|eukprot:CDW77520.1 UNKNOWN [Stylonychia lemnae]